ncbi:hypothetical protein BN938_1951 [Mucinivorans hirudinis]|uniref:Uncharacterized protein n=1 Tax=Mucinivorans hirudinis TaxID=1433126 RepID=A0A060RD98_9BACT|nr:hypothetical protein BN938_1951 [Mucinivorans hirudinis]
MTDQQIYAGEDLGILLRITDAGDDSPVDISQFDFEATLYNPAILNSRVTASTLAGSANELQKRDDGLLGFNVSGKQSSQFSTGRVVFEFARIDKETKKREIIVHNILEVKDSKIGR